MATISFHPVRAVALVVGICIAEAAATGLLRWGVSAPLAELGTPGATGLEAALVLVAAGVAWLCLTWLTLGVLLTTLATVPALARHRLDRVAEHCTPLALRRVTAAVLGAAVAGGATGLAGGPAAAAGPAPHTAQLVLQAAPATVAISPAPALPDLDRPAPQRDRGLPELDRPAPDAQQASGTGAGRADRLVVRPGDTLWDLAARSLGPRATKAQIAAAWPRWYLANRRSIGADADVLRPGTTLRPPAE